MITVFEDKTLFDVCDVVQDNRMVTVEQWRKTRMKYIGASESAKVLGYSKYGSPMTVFADKTGLTPPFEGNIHTKFGTRMESVIAEWLDNDFEEETGNNITICEYPFQLVSKENPYMAANLDRIAMLEKDMVDMITGEIVTSGVWFPIEIKTASEMLVKLWDGEEVPTEYYIQCQHQMAVTGTPMVMLVYLIGKKLGWKFIQRNDSDIAMIVNGVNNFVDNYMVPNIMPDPSGLSDETKIIIGVNGLSEGDVYLPEADELIDKYDGISAQIKELETEKTRIMQTIMTDKAGNKKCHGARRTFNSWEVSRSKHDMKLLEQKYPDILKEITTGVSVYANYRTGKVK